MIPLVSCQKWELTRGTCAKVPAFMFLWLTEVVLHEGEIKLVTIFSKNLVMINFFRYFEPKSIALSNKHFNHIIGKEGKYRFIDKKEVYEERAKRENDMLL